MKKILFVTSNLGIGGAQQHLILFANYLVAQGYEVLILNTNLNNDLAYRLDAAVELVNIPRKYNFDLKPAGEILKITRERGIKTVFCDSLFSYLYANKLNRIKGINIHIIFHNTIYAEKYNYIKDLAVRFLVRRKTRLIAVAQNQIAHLSKVLMIPDKRFKLIYNGIDVGKFNLAERDVMRTPDLRAELGIPEQAFVLVKTARFAIEKNHEMAVEVLDLLRRQHGIDAYMLFVGASKNGRSEKVEALAEERAVRDYVKIVGPQKDVRPYLAVSNGFILTSISETFSLAALEAMGMGLPCLLTDIGGAREMVTDGKNGYITPARDAAAFADAAAKLNRGALQWRDKEIFKLIETDFNLEATNQRLENYIFNYK